MNRPLLFAALLAGAVLAPQVALADAMSSNDMMSAAGSTMVCRAAHTDEKATATTADTHTPLVCKTVDMKKAPDMSKMTTPAQVDAAWRQFFQIQMNSL
jgi:hypothetical protein